MLKYGFNDINYAYIHFYREDGKYTQLTLPRFNGMMNRQFTSLFTKHSYKEVVVLMHTSSKVTGLERRREDYIAITGRSRYVDDIRSLPSHRKPLFMVVVRSPYAHAKIEAIYLENAKALPGVVAAFTGEELVRGMRTLESMPVAGLRKPERRPFAIGRVRFGGKFRAASSSKYF